MGRKLKGGSKWKCSIRVVAALTSTNVLWLFASERREQGHRTNELRRFGTMTGDLLRLRKWLLEAGCTHVAMESTGMYWRPVYDRLYGHAGDGGDQCATHARRFRVGKLEKKPISNWTRFSVISLASQAKPSCLTLAAGETDPQRLANAGSPKSAGETRPAGPSARE